MATFAKAFSAARKAGKKAFTWNGKRYNTKVATDTPKSAPVPTPRPSATKVVTTSPKARGEREAFIASEKKRQNDDLRAKSAKGSMGTPKLTIGARIADSVRIGATAVSRGKRSDAAAKANAGAGSAVSNMLKGMDKTPKVPTPNPRRKRK